MPKGGLSFSCLLMFALFLKLIIEFKKLIVEFKTVYDREVTIEEKA